MLILPGEHRYRALPWVPSREWREPSLAQPKDQRGNANRVRFRFIAQGCVPWVGWCDSREDADAFLEAMLRCTYLGEVVPPSIWRLPTPHWHPDIGAEVWWATTQSLTSPTGSNQTFTSPSDWNNSNNSVEVLAGGASGASSSATGAHETGGGGGEYGATTSFSFVTPGTTTATWRVGVGGTAVVKTGGTAAGGVNGGDSWWDGTTQAGSTLGAIHGSAGVNGGGNRSGGVGGTGGVGTTHKAGGRGGNLSGASGDGASGGGGAGGSTAAGAAGTNSSSTGTTVQTDGGQGDPSVGGAAGVAGGTVTGGDGTEFDSTHGSGGGGAGDIDATGNATAGNGGNYGGGGGGAKVNDNSKTATSGAGIQGMIFLTYTPLVYFRRTLGGRVGSRSQ